MYNWQLFGRYVKAYADTHSEMKKETIINTEKTGKIQ